MNTNNEDGGNRDTACKASITAEPPPNHLKAPIETDCSKSSSDTTGISDEELAARLRAHAAAKSEMLVVVNGFTSALFARNDAASDWGLVAAGDFNQSCLNAAKPLIRQKALKWAATKGDPHEIPLGGLAYEVATTSNIKGWLTAAERRMKGRTGEVSPKTMQEVAMRAAWRCQFSGCGKDLRTHFSTGRRGNYGYFAHIVASSADGPRGNVHESPQLADDPSNIMLACDECHRLIDRVAPNQYGVQVLREMRERSVQHVERLLDTLRYPEVEPIVLVGNVSGQPHHFLMRNAEEALWQAGVRPTRGEPEFFCLNGNHLHDPHAQHYWGSLFEAFKTDIPRLQALLNGTRTGRGARPPLAVFPLHGTSILILGGRLIGDTGGVHLFQFHRDQVASNPGAQWAWPKDAAEPASDKYQVSTLRDWNGEDEACLLVSLTFEIQPERLPDCCADSSGFKLPTIQVSADHFGSDVINHPKDLEHFGRVLDQALRRIQDEWKVRRVFLFVGAPATACFRVGQKMQARNQATFVCHETARGIGSAFKPTIEISSSAVVEPVSGQSVTL